MAPPKKRLLGLKRGPLIRARVSTYVKNGVLCVRAPRADSAASDTPMRRLQNKKFAQASRLARLTPAPIMNGLIDAVKGRPWFLYDWIISAIYARAFYITDENGITYYPMGLAQDVSKNLDVLGQMPGDTLFRGETIWQRLPVGLAGQAMALAGTPPAPAWVPGQGPYLLAEVTPVSGVIDIQGLDLTTLRTFTAYLEGVTASNNAVAINLQLYCGGTLITSGYNYAGYEVSTGGGTSNPTAVGAGSVPIFSSLGNAAGKTAYAEITFNTPDASRQKMFTSTGAFNYQTTNSAWRSISGFIPNTSNIDGLRLTASAGTILTGRLRLYGTPFPAV